MGWNQLQDMHSGGLVRGQFYQVQSQKRGRTEMWQAGSWWRHVRTVCVSGIGADVYDNGAHRNRSLGVCEDRLKSHLDCSGHLALCIFTSAYCRVTVVTNMDLEVCTVEGGDFLSR